MAVSDTAPYTPHSALQRGQAILYWCLNVYLVDVVQHKGHVSHWGSPLYTNWMSYFENSFALVHIWTFYKYPGWRVGHGLPLISICGATSAAVPWPVSLINDRQSSTLICPSDPQGSAHGSHGSQPQFVLMSSKVNTHRVNMKMWHRLGQRRSLLNIFFRFIKINSYDMLIASSRFPCHWIFWA